MKWTFIFALIGGVLGTMLLCSLPVDTHGPDYWKNIAEAVPYFMIAGGGFGLLLDLLGWVFRRLRVSAAEKSGD